MNIIEYKDGYVFERECGKRIPDKYKIEFDISDTVSVIFGRRKTGKYDLCDLIFDKESWSIWGAASFWEDFQFDLVRKKDAWNKKYPKIFWAIDVKECEYTDSVVKSDGDLFLIVWFRNEPKYKSLKGQMADLQHTDGCLVDERSNVYATNVGDIQNNQKEHNADNVFFSYQKENNADDAPLSYEDAKKMFHYIGREECDGTLKRTKAWLKQHFHDTEKEEQAIVYIKDYGGYCDCEVIFNASDKHFWK